MIIEDKGIILSVRPFQESWLIVKCFLREHGVVSGLCRAGRASYILVPCNVVKARWSGKSGGLGYYSFESLMCVFALVAASYRKMLVINSVVQILDVILQEKDTQLVIFDITERFFQKIISYDLKSGNQAIIELAAEYLLFELAILKEGGFGLDLTKCVVSGQKHDLTFISPKSGCAVSSICGAPYESKLFRVPKFFLCKVKKTKIETEEIELGFIITNYFMRKYLLGEYQIKNLMYRDKLCEMFVLLNGTNLRIN